MNYHRRFVALASLAIAISFVPASCSNNDPDPRTEQANDEANGVPPNDPPSDPDADGGAANHSLCSAFSSKCAYTYIWPLDPEAGVQTCYCECATFDDCKNMPGGKTICGTLLESDGMGGLQPVFPQGWPTVCRN